MMGEVTMASISFCSLPRMISFPPTLPEVDRVHIVGPTIPQEWSQVFGNVRAQSNEQDRDNGYCCMTEERLARSPRKKTKWFVKPSIG